MCYSNIIYAADRLSAEVAAVCRTHSSVVKTEYNWGGQGFTSEGTHSVDSSFADALSLEVKATDDSGTEYTVDMEAVNFLWQGAAINQDAAYQNGQKGAIVEMFGWPHEDVKQECEYLAKQGWMGVKVFPVTESVFSYEWPQNGELNPWWFYYQPVSYKLAGRGGTREELREMIQACRGVGVRVYADAVVNHMSGGGNDVLDHRNGGSDYCSHWGGKSTTGESPSPYFTHNWTYEKSDNTGLVPGMEYPNAAYIPTDFHCERPLNSWTDPFLLNNGWLSGLADLDTESEYVRERIAAYMTDLISIGFSGYRIDAAKHIQPESLAAILAKVKRNLGGGDLPDDFITYLEVLVGGEKDLLFCQEGDYSFGQAFADKMKAAGLSDSDVAKVKIWDSSYPKEFPICGYWETPAERLAIENDCHDDQNPGSSSRDMQDKGSVLVREKDVSKHRGFEEQLFQRTDGDWAIKLVLSSYTFMDDGAMGIPDGKSDCSACKGDQCSSCTLSMAYSKAFDADACGYTCEVDGQWQQGVYTRVHRDYDIIQAMRDWQGLPKVTDAGDLGLPSNCGSSKAAEGPEFLGFTPFLQ